MHLSIKKRSLLPGLVTGLGFVATAHVSAQIFRTLYSFTATPFSSPYTNNDGSHPHGILLLWGNTLYGTAWQGGTNGNGTVFTIKTDGTGFTNLHTFSALNRSTNSDGANPQAGLVLSTNILYGTASAGGTWGKGTVFGMNIDGSGFTNLYSFTGGGDGGSSYAELILVSNTLYGTTSGDSTSGSGTVFAIHIDGSGFTNLYRFTGGGDGARPVAGLVLSHNTLYGTTSGAGTSGKGTVFGIGLDGTGFTNLYSFTGGSDGASPYSGLLLSGDTLYGMANRGGTSGYGTVFAVNTDGTGFRNLHSFTYTNGDGAYPNGGVLVLFGNALYSTTTGGGTGHGIVFAVNPNGPGFEIVHALSLEGDPWSGLILSGNTLYGTANYGGASSSGSGTVFSIVLQPELTIIPAAPVAVLTWSTNYADFILQSTTNLAAPAVWITNLPAPVVVNGLNTVTNHDSGSQQFFRLSH